MVTTRRQTAAKKAPDGVKAAGPKPAALTAQQREQQLKIRDDAISKITYASMFVAGGINPLMRLWRSDLSSYTSSDFTPKFIFDAILAPAMAVITLTICARILYVSSSFRIALEHLRIGMDLLHQGQYARAWSIAGSAAIAIMAFTFFIWMGTVAAFVGGGEGVQPTFGKGGIETLGDLSKFGEVGAWAQKVHVWIQTPVSFGK